VLTTAVAGPGDAAAVAALLRHAGVPAGQYPRAARQVEAVASRLAGPVPLVRALLARDGTELAGVAPFWYLWPVAGLEHALCVRDMFVHPAWRRRGVALLLAGGLRDLARAHGCVRIDWLDERTGPGRTRRYEVLDLPLD